MRSCRQDDSTSDNRAGGTERCRRRDGDGEMDGVAEIGPSCIAVNRPTNVNVSTLRPDSARIWSFIAEPSQMLRSRDGVQMSSYWGL
jgi:hypothetical protein